VNIFNLFHYKIGLDGRNFQFGALDALGIDVGAVSGGCGGHFMKSPIVNPRNGIFY
jgi:hypothetical protein